MQISNRGIFIVSTPFQVILSFEAINNYKIDDYEFIITSISKNKVLQSIITSKIEKSITFFNKSKIQIINATSLSEFFKRLFKFNISNSINSFTNNYIFIGNAVSFYQNAFRFKFNFFDNLKLIYLDDGNSSIGLIRYGDKYIYKGIQSKFYKLIFDLNSFVFNTKINTIYSIFDIYSNWIKVDNNKLLNLKKHLKFSHKEVNLIIGSPLVELKQLSILEYKNIIKKVVNDFEESKIIYIPHPRENIDDISKYLFKKNIDIINPTICIEIDMIKLKYKPVKIFSFMSTASYSLKLIYPHCISICYFVNYANSSLKKEYNEIAEFYKTKGIICKKINNL